MSARKKKTKPRATRVQLTHFEVRRGGALRLRLAIADNALAGVGDELGALLRKIAPSAVSTSTVVPSAVSPGAFVMVTPSECAVLAQHAHAHDDDKYHERERDRLAEIFGSLCDSLLADALEIAREECSRREGVN